MISNFPVATWDYKSKMLWHERLNQRFSELGWSIKKLSDTAGLSYDRVNKYLRGDVENPRGDALQRLGKAVGRDETWLLYGYDLTSVANDQVSSARLRTPIRGEVAAGVWLDITEPGDENPRSWLPFGFHPDYGTDTTFALVVRGNSVDKIAPDGSMVLCWAGGSEHHGNGELVVVERVRGHLREVTVKRLWRRDGDLLLFPESNDERWKPIRFRRDTEDGEHTVRVLARVLFVVSEPATPSPIYNPRQLIEADSD